jgi:AcrR family transcriptional regulator
MMVGMDDQAANSPQGAFDVEPPTDPRAARTREAIFAGIEQLMSSPRARVTVQDIVRASGVSRSSFYVHFAGLEDLALAFLTRQIDIIGEAGVGIRQDDLVAGPAAARIGYGRLVEHIVQHYPLYSTALEGTSTRRAFEAAIDSYSRRLLRTVLTLDVAPGNAHPEVVVAYVAGGALTVISSWMRGEFEIDDDELVQQLVDLLPEWVRRDRREESETQLT